MQEPSHTRSRPPATEPNQRVSDLVTQAAAIIREELGAKTRLMWFGSWVTGRATERSDIDLAVVPEEPVPPTQWARVRERIEALPTLYAFDLVVLPEVGAQLRKEIERDGIEL